MDKQAEIERVSRAMGRMRVLIGRRVISRLALVNVAPGLELSDLDVLLMVPGAGGKTAHVAAGSVPAEVSVGEIARNLRIDPSRASRLVARLVEQGFLQRTVSQEDGRRSVLQRSEAGDLIFDEIRHVKTALIRDAVGGWPQDRLERFSADFEEFTLALDAQLAPGSDEAA